MLANHRPWFFAVACWAGLLFFLSSRAVPEVGGPQIPHLDKIAHAVYFTAGSACFFMGVRLLCPRRHGRFALLLAVLFCAVVGALDEFHQSFVPERMGNDPFDWMADVLGGFLGSAVGAIFHGWVKSKELVLPKNSR
jgi:VanZ family protein